MALPPDFDAAHFWAGSAYALKAYTEPAPSDELISRVEADLGYRLPAFYVALMRVRNGGVACGPQGEPAVVHIDQEDDYLITPLAPNFEAFVRGLVPASVFEE